MQNSEQKRRFIDRYPPERDNIGVFYRFYLFLDSWHKNCYKDR